MRYSDIEPFKLDREYLDSLSEKYGIDWQDLEIEPTNWVNGIFYELLLTIAYQEVDNLEDRGKIIDSIYCNCLDSGYDIDSDSLDTQQAKDFINNF